MFPEQGLSCHRVKGVVLKVELFAKGRNMVEANAGVVSLRFRQPKKLSEQRFITFAGLFRILGDGMEILTFS